ncbi:TOMM precursor leader peptide-binding protein [Pseudoxanthobacter sp. M-2]|uniref:TOMM precursor leader peptide-binding protein n=1 Tax=Pseudoxanthobacter sp. M-2 TaxID=3078754 RepID=UPI0038FD354B
MSHRSAPIGFAPGIAAHVISATEVLLLTEGDPSVLRGAAYVQIAPLLDGTRTEDEVVGELAGAVDGKLAYYALARLKALGQVSAVPDPAQAVPMPQVLSEGVGEEIVAAFEAQLRELLGACCPAPAGTPPLTVLLLDDYLRPHVAERAAAATAAGRAFLPLVPVGRTAWLGPYVGPDAPADVPLLVARIRLNRAHAANLADAGRFPLQPERRRGVAPGLLVALAASVAARCASGEVPDSVAGALTRLDGLTGAADRHPLPPPRVAVRTTFPVVALEPRRKRFFADGGHRVCPPDETLQTLMLHVDPLLGIVPGFVRLDTEEGVYVFGSPMRLAPSGDGPLSFGRRALGACGKGQGRTQSLVSCLAESVERHSSMQAEGLPARRASRDELGEAAVSPEAIHLFSAAQVARGTPPDSSPPHLDRVPGPVASDAPIHWTDAWSLTHGRVRHVPLALCVHGYRPPSAGADSALTAHSTGCASGNTIEEAVLQGFLEVAERDAIAVWWYNRCPRPGVDLASFRDPFFDESVARFDARDMDLAVIDITNDLGIAAMVATVSDRRTGGQIRLGIGCHLEPRIAISRAICELHQMMPYVQAVAGLAGYSVLKRWMAEATLASEPHVAPRDGPRITRADLGDQSRGDVLEEVELCVAKAAALGHETLVLDMTRSDIGFPVARVIVPGLRNLTPAFAPGRLYDLPVRLGWLDRPRREEEMNPVPFFL